jgi:hypothetical protein
VYNFIAVSHARNRLRYADDERSLAAISSALLLGATAPPAMDSNGGPNPYAIYERVRNVLAADRYPDRFQYRVTVGVLEGGTAKAEHYHCESVDGDVRPLGASDEEHDAPHYVDGIDLRLTMTLGWDTHLGGPSQGWSMAGNRKEALPDFFGVPLLSPAYMFGLNAAANDDAATPDANAAGSLHSIATVVSENRAYNISFAGEESLHGIQAYHLQLRPLRQASVYRLRDLWIDKATYDVLQANVQGNFTNAPMTKVPWTVEFATVAGATYIASETTTATLQFRRDRSFDGARIVFDDISDATGTVPALPNVVTQGVLREP